MCPNRQQVLTDCPAEGNTVRSGGGSAQFVNNDQAVGPSPSIHVHTAHVSNSPRWLAIAASKHVSARVHAIQPVGSDCLIFNNKRAFVRLDPKQARGGQRQGAAGRLPKALGLEVQVPMQELGQAWIKMDQGC